MDRPLTLASERSDTGRTMSTETSDPPMISSASVFRHLPVCLQIGLYVLLHSERHIGVPDALAQRFPVDLRIAARRRVAVPHVMKADLGETGRSGQLLEPARNGVRVDRAAVLPAEQQPVIVVVGAKLGTAN
jgi:hypothetical protein